MTSAHSITASHNKMNRDSIQINERREKLLKAFLNQVPGRVSAILENWQQLIEDWDNKLLETLLERINALSEASGKFGITEIKQSGESLHTHLARYDTPDAIPTRQDLKALDGLVHAFRDAATQACNQQPSKATSRQSQTSDAAAESILYLLGIDEGMVPGLSQELEQVQFKTRRVESTAELTEALQKRNGSASALISHTAWLNELYPSSQEGGLWHREGGISDLQTAFISDSKDLQTRLAAMRTDAKAYWTLPVDAQLIANRMRELTSPREHAAYKVLIVEDDISQIDFATGILKKAGFECRGVSDPLRVMDLLHDFKPDLILMDLYMPGASGAELTTVIREEQEFINIPIVFLSGEQDRDKQLSALSFGGEDFLSKPISPKLLIKAVTLRIRRARQLSHNPGSESGSDKKSPFLSRNYLFDRVDQHSPSADSDGVDAVLYAQIDKAEQIIDSLGISGMDVAMSEIGMHLRSLLQPRDILSRLGDHSLGLLVHRDSIAELETLGKQLCRHLSEQIIEVEGQTLLVTLSIGAYTLDGEPRDANTLFSLAKAASGMALQAGGNQTYVQRPEKPSKTRGGEEKKLQKLIRKAITENYFDLFFQPMVALKGNSDEDHYQALIRLQEPDGRLLTARDFIPAAESMGVISHIDQWATRKAISIIQASRQQNNHLHLFVSQSAELLDNIERLTWLREKQRTGQLIENSLTFEFRLNDVAQNLNSARICFDMLGKIGVSTLLTGASLSAESQSTLKHLKVGYIKLDTHLLHDSPTQLKELIGMAHDHKIKVIAPQVEDPRSIAQLWSSGADFVQGNFVQRPESNLMYDFRESILM
jgi:diguanylate cyclase (GGDEF)-like protein